MALRRWKPFFPAFGAIDTVIEAATGGCSRDKYRQARSYLVEMLCDAADSGDDVRAEALCRLLDTAMAEALLTLGRVPMTTTTTEVAADVAKAVGGLLRHETGKVRALAGGVLAEWKASLEGAAMDTLLQILRELEVAAPATGGCVRSGGPETTTVLQADSIKQATKISDLECKRPNKMSSPGVPIAGGDRVRNEQTGEAKRKHPGPGTGGCYREADDDVKRRRKVPEMVEHEHRPRKTESAMKSRSRASSWRSTDERRFSTSTRHGEVLVRAV